MILAAGAGRRIGGPKALLRAGERSFLAQAAALLGRPGVELLVAVVGDQAGRVTAAAGLSPSVQVVVNGRYQDGMLTSVLAGLDAAEAAGADAVLLHPVDHPLVAAATVDRVIAALLEGTVVAVPSYDDRRGHPAGFARPAFAALRAVPPDVGARAVLAARPEWVVHVRGDAGCVAGIDTADDYRRLLGGDPSFVG